MSDVLRIACVQMHSTSVKAHNLERADRHVARAASEGADIVLLSEKWNAYGSAEVFREAAEPLDGGETVEAMSSWARRHGVSIVGGSITELREGHEKLSNTCVVFNAEGERVAIYRKIHMFDVDVGGHVYRESEAEEPGTHVENVELEDWNVGLTICYDVRFPELYRILALRGAELITVPAAFTLYTGRDHWELLLRARAVENQCYIAGAGAWGTDESTGRATFGRSMIIDPWGIVLATAPDEDAVVTAAIDRSRLATIRQSLPSLANRQPDAYEWPTDREPVALGRI